MQVYYEPSLCTVYDGTLYNEGPREWQICSQKRGLVISRFHCTISLLLVTVVNLVQPLTLVLFFLNFFINVVV